MNAAPQRLLIDPYLDWTAAEALPIHEDFGVDLLTADTAPGRGWAIAARVPSCISRAAATG